MPVPIQILKTSPLFAGFTDTGLNIIGQIARLRDLPKGMSLFLEGAPGDAMYIIKDGTIEILVGQGDAAKVVCQLGAGEHFGELALLRPGRRAVSARAQGSCRLVELKRADFGELLKQKPQACMKLMLAVMGTIHDRVDAIRPELRSLI